MREAELASVEEGPGEATCLVLAPLIVFVLYYLHHRQLHWFKREWRDKAENSVSALSHESKDRDHSLRSTTHKLLSQFTALQGIYEAEAEACHHTISEVQIAVSKLQLECQGELTCCVVEEKTHSPFQIASPKKNRSRKGSLLSRANSVI